MTGCLSTIRFLYQDHILIYQTFLCRRKLTMSNGQENTPHPIGSFVINPLIVQSDKKSDPMVNESACSTICVKEIKESDANKCKNKNIIAEVNVMDMHLEQLTKTPPTVFHEKVQDVSVEPSILPCSVKPELENSNLSGETNLMMKSADVPDSNSTLMMKLAISGPPKCKFDEKKTVLPQSLLHGVTELVKKQQLMKALKISNPENKKISVSLEGSLGRGDAPAVYDLKSVSFSKKHSFEAIEKADELGNRNCKQLNIEEPVTDCSSVNRNLSLVDTNKVPCNENSGAEDPDCRFSKHENEIQTALSDSSQQQMLEKQDSEIETQELNLSSLNELVTSEKICEDNPLFEMDLDNLIDCKNHEETNKEAGTSQSISIVRETSKELFDDVKSVSRKKEKTTEDIIYDLSALFSGKLEERRKKELKKQKRKAKNFERFSKDKKKSGNSDDKDKLGTSEEEKKPIKTVPNYFVAIQITDEQIKSGLEAVQDKVVGENLKLKPAMNKLATLHLTMLVLSLKTQEDMDRSRQALEKASEKLLSFYTDVSLTLDVCGLGHFRNNVVFAKVKHDHQVSTLKNVAEIVEESFLEQDIISPDQRGFKPHITIMKLSSVKGSKKKGLKKIDEKLYSEFIDTNFGCESIHTLQLCAMMKPKDKLGYYQVEHKVQFAKIPDNKLAESCPNTTVEISDGIKTDPDLNDEAKTYPETKSITVESVDIITVNNKKDLKALSEDKNLSDDRSSGNDINSYNDSAIDLSEKSELSHEVTQDIIPKNDSVILDISGDSDTSKEEVLLPMSDNDSALDISLQTESGSNDIPEDDNAIRKDFKANEEVLTEKA